MCCAVRRPCMISAASHPGTNRPLSLKDSLAKPLILLEHFKVAWLSLFLGKYVLKVQRNVWLVCRSVCPGTSVDIFLTHPSHGLISPVRHCVRPFFPCLAGNFVLITHWKVKDEEEIPSSLQECPIYPYNVFICMWFNLLCAMLEKSGNIFIRWWFQRQELWAQRPVSGLMSRLC